MTELNIACYIINLAVILLCWGIFAILPRITRKTFLFGVRIPEQGQLHAESLRLKKQYIGGICVISIISLGLATAQFFLWEEMSVLAVMYLPLLLAAAQFIIYVNCWKGAKALKKSEGWTPAQIVAADTRTSYANSKMQSSLNMWKKTRF